MSEKLKKSEFSRHLVDWQRKYGRKDLPWQRTRDPYRRWLAEVMLQQTQVNTVIPYYQKFLKMFPNVRDLAKAKEEDVLSLWAGLGYYSRARNLLLTAKEIIEKYDGHFPLDEEILVQLPGIGQSTAGAIVSAVTDRPCVILDGNVKRVLCRYLKVDQPLGELRTERFLLSKAKEFLPKDNGRDYAQALMDLGATVCKRNDPDCLLCPIEADCKAFLSGKQNFYPIKKQKRKIPTEELHVEVCFKDGKVFLVKQEERFWKGLWTLPLCQSDTVEKRLPTVTHRLTHIELKIIPYMVNSAVVANERGRWFGRDEISKGPIPTPIKRLLLPLCDDM